VGHVLDAGKHAQRLVERLAQVWRNGAWNADCNAIATWHPEGAQASSFNGGNYLGDILLDGRDGHDDDHNEY
jgi:hypothetical protein